MHPKFQKEGFVLKKAVLFCLCFCMLLGGCGRRVNDAEPPKCRVVTGVDVTFENSPFRMQWHYNTSAKMRAILNYLRWLDPYGKPEQNPEKIAGNYFEIIVSYSDGCSKTYVQKADQFFWEDGQGWKRIDPKRAITLSQILGKMQSDP